MTNRKINRRRFLGRTVVSIPAMAPFLLNATDKTGLKPRLVGFGEHTYLCHHDWALDSLPTGHTYGGANIGRNGGVSHGVAINEGGLIFITHHGNPGSIFVFTAEGKFVRSMGEVHNVFDKDSGFSRGFGHGIDIRREGNDEFIYLAPNTKELPFAKLTLSGERVWIKDKESIHKDSGLYTKGVGYRPTNTSFRPDGGYYLGDGYGSYFIFEYDKNDKFVRGLGGRGKNDGEFRLPHGQWLDQRNGTPKLVVADRVNSRLQWFNMEGAHLQTIGGFLFPADVDVLGDLMVVPDLHARVTLLDGDNKVIVHLGDDEKWRQRVLDKNEKMRDRRDKWESGKFVHPHDACFDHHGNIFVTEWVNGGRVTKLEKVG
jgi:hypothetical protein